MQKLLSLGPKEILSGMANGEHMSNGVFSGMKNINLFTIPDRYGCLTTTYNYRNAGEAFDGMDKVTDVVEYDDPDFDRWSPTFYSYSRDGSFANLGNMLNPHQINEIDSGNKGLRSGSSGMVVYNNDIYLFSKDDIAKYDVDDGTMDNEWGSGLDKKLNDWNGIYDSWKSPFVYNGYLWFCNGNYLGYYNGQTLETEYFQLPFGNNAVDIAEYNGMLAILCVDLRHFSSTLVLYDGFSPNASYIHSKNGLYYSLSNFRRELVLGGADVVFFNSGNFQSLYMNKNYPISEPNKMQHRDGILYWADGKKIMAYGSRVNTANNVFFSPYEAATEELSTFKIGFAVDAIFSADQIGTPESVRAHYSYYAYLLDRESTNPYTGEAVTINFDVGNASIRKIGVSHSGIDEVNTEKYVNKITVFRDDLYDSVLDSDSVEMDFVNSENVGKTYSEKQTIMKPARFIKLKIELKNVFINRIDIYGTPTDRTN